MLKLKKLLIENSGPINLLQINFGSRSDGTPKPLILVGENGAGKTTALSFIIDALLQLAAKKFDDVLTNRGAGTLYYRLRSHDVKLGSENSVSHIQFELHGRPIDYVDRIGSDVNLQHLRERLNLGSKIILDPKLEIEKCHSKDLDDLGETLADGVYVFFPSGRREDPHWLQSAALRSEDYSTAQRFGNKANKSFVIETAAKETANWIMDGLLDRAIGYASAGAPTANQILQAILEDPTAHFAVAPRNIWPRIQIYTGKSDSRRLRIPSLAHLSAGQSMLLSMFATIANQGSLTKAKEPQEIEGIAVIDEAEVYLHTHLQRAVLPALIKKFPKVQFVITTHSPSFLMGMKDSFPDRDFDIVEMPGGNSIDVDQFAEIGAAIESLRESSAFRNEVRAQISAQKERPLLVVEGKSDVIIVEGAWSCLYGGPPPFQILNAKGRRALRYLLEDEVFVDEVADEQIVLGLFDFDEAYDDWKGCQSSYPNREGNESTGLLRRHSHKKIYAGLMPIPPSRTIQANDAFGSKSVFTIELYLPDENLSANKNLESIVYPGNVNISKFCGDKVAFAERVANSPELAAHFLPLLTMIKRVLGV